MQHNCYTCKYRSEVPGSAHSSCNVSEDKLFVAAFVARSSGDFPNLKLNQYGMKTVGLSDLSILSLAGLSDVIFMRK